jgi:hypothetical protein
MAPMMPVLIENVKKPPSMPKANRRRTTPQVRQGLKPINDVDNLEASLDADANSTCNAQPDEQQTNLQYQGTTNSNESNAVSYFVTFYLMHTIAHMILCWSPTLIR